MGRSAPLRGPRPSCQRSPSIVEPPGPSLSLHQGQCRSGGRKSLRPADAQFRTKGSSPLSPRTGLGGWLRETWAAGADVNVRPTFTTGVLSHPQRKKETEAFIPESRKGSPAWSAAVGPLCLSQGRDCLPACLPGPPGPSAFCRRSLLDHRWRKIRVWNLGSCLFVPNVSWKQTPATQPGGHSRAEQTSV